MGGLSLLLVLFLSVAGIFAAGREISAANSTVCPMDPEGKPACVVDLSKGASFEESIDTVSVGSDSVFGYKIGQLDGAKCVGWSKNNTGEGGG